MRIPETTVQFFTVEENLGGIFKILGGGFPSDLENAGFSILTELSTRIPLYTLSNFDQLKAGIKFRLLSAEKTLKASARNFVRGILINEFEIG